MGINLLIVEDVPEMGLLLKEVFEREAWVKRVSWVKNGIEAEIELNRNRPDLVLLDELLPGESALDLIERWKTYSIKILLMSGMTEGRDLPQGVLGRVHKTEANDLSGFVGLVKKHT